jgi:predicted kinase
MSRFEIIDFGDTAIVLDAESGSLSEVSGTGRLLSAWLAELGDIEAVARRVSAHFGIDEARAMGDVRGLFDALTRSTPAKPRPMAFEREGDAHHFVYQGRRIARLDNQGNEARWEGPKDARPDPEWRLRLLMPHMLMLRGLFVLHASAVRLGERLIALTGASGSGKSTTARLLARGEPVSDDLLLVSLAGNTPQVWLEAERALRAFCARHAERFGAGEPVWVTRDDLASFQAGPRATLDAIWILDASRRQGARFAETPLAPAKATAALVMQGFGEVEDGGVWRHLLRSSARLASTRRVAEVTAPAGLEALHEAASVLNG